MEFSHISVLLDESINSLSVKQIGIYVDGTLGGGGHSSRLLTQSEGAKLIGIDRDTEALAAAKKRLEQFGDRVTYHHGNYCEIKEILKLYNTDGIDGAILDLGVSSYQLDNRNKRKQ